MLGLHNAQNRKYNQKEEKEEEKKRVEHGTNSKVFFFLRLTLFWILMRTFHCIQTTRWCAIVSLDRTFVVLNGLHSMFSNRCIQYTVDKRVTAH